MKTHISLLKSQKTMIPLLVTAGLLLGGCAEKSGPLVVVAGENAIAEASEAVADAEKAVPGADTPDETQEAAFLTETETPEPFVPKTIHIMAIGDNLLHEGIISTGKQADGTYNFDFEFADIKPYIDAADISVINQETPLAGNSIGFKGYPLFNSPTEVGDAIAAAGFNVVTAATNHAYDQKAKGLISYADYFAQNYPDIALCGIRGNLPNLHGEPKLPDAEPVSAYDTEPNPSEPETMSPESVQEDTAESVAEDAPAEDGNADVDPALSTPEVYGKGRNPRIQYLEVQGYTFALLNYTYGTNLATYPSDAEGHLDMLCDYNRSNRMLNFTALNDYVLPDIAEASLTSDFVIVFPHWGNEYQTSPSMFQTAWAKNFIDAGADLVIGCHPHVVQPVEHVTTDLGNEGLVYYSLGNYASLQRQRRAMFEAMAWVTLTDDEEGTLHIVEERSGALPMVMQYTTGARFQSVVPLDAYTEELASSHGIITRGEGKLSIPDMNKWADDLMGSYRMSPEEILSVTSDPLPE